MGTVVGTEPLAPVKLRRSAQGGLPGHTRDWREARLTVYAGDPLRVASVHSPTNQHAVVTNG